VSFLATGETRDYLITTSLENVLFLGIVVEIAFLILLSQSIINSRWHLSKVLTWVISLQALVFLLFTARFFLRSNLAPIVFIGCLGVTTLIHFCYPRNSTTIAKMRLLYISYGIMAAVASNFFLAQFMLYEKPFKLKTGLTLFAALLIMSMATLDRRRDLMPPEHVWRFRLAIVSAIIFAYVMIAKSLMWHAAVYKLEQTLWHTEGSCVEMVSTDFQWLEDSPYTIINNWALPSLALVEQDKRPRKLILEQNGCQLFFQSGMVQIDPWSVIGKKDIVPPLD
jgi:hypothetical protein